MKIQSGQRYFGLSLQLARSRCQSWHCRKPLGICSSDLHVVDTGVLCMLALNGVTLEDC